MSLDFTAEVWESLRSHIDQYDRKDAADTLINLLIDHNHDADEIKLAFKGDKDVMGALKYYMEQHEDATEYEEDEEEDADDEWN